MSVFANRCAVARLPLATACCQSMNLQDSLAMRAASSNSFSKILPLRVRGLAVDRTRRCFSISRSAARMFFAGMREKKVEPSWQNNSREPGSGAAMAQPIGVQFLLLVFQSAMRQSKRRRCFGHAA